jgi:hypothetical protein
VYTAGDDNASGQAKRKAYLQGVAAGGDTLPKEGANVPDVKLREKGRKVSGSNELRLRAAVAALSAVLSQLPEQTDDGDGEEGKTAAKESLTPELVAALKEVKGLLESLVEAEGGGHTDAFTKMGADAQNAHLKDKHGASGDQEVPAKRIAAHSADHKDTPDHSSDKKESADIDILGDTVPLVEKALRADGTHPIKIIAPGWGSSGHYSKEVLQRDGPKIFPVGTKMFWDHPTRTEESDRPERSIRDMAAVTVTAPRYMDAGPDGPGLYADAKPLTQYAESIEELAKHIGVSIRAAGRAVHGEAEGRHGPIIQEMTHGHSIDYVTQAGAGGKICQLFESKRQGGTRPPVPENDDNPEDDMTEAQQRELQEAKAQVARLQEMLLFRESRDFIEAQLRGQANPLPEPTIRRLAEALAHDPPVVCTDNLLSESIPGTLDKTKMIARIKEGIKAEAAYIQAITGAGTVRGFGGTPSQEVSEADQLKSRTEAFKLLGLSESTAKLAAQGRG